MKNNPTPLTFGRFYNVFPKSYELDLFEIAPLTSQDIVAYYFSKTKELHCEYLDESSLICSMSDVSDADLLCQITMAITDLCGYSEFKERFKSRCNVLLVLDEDEYIWNLGFSQACFFHECYDEDRFLKWSKTAILLLHGDITAEVYDSISF